MSPEEVLVLVLEEEPVGGPVCRSAVGVAGVMATERVVLRGEGFRGALALWKRSEEGREEAREDAREDDRELGGREGTFVTAGARGLTVAAGVVGRPANGSAE